MAASAACKKRAAATRWTCPRTASSSASTPTARRWIASGPATWRLLATPPAFRWVHFGYAIQKGLNVFMEKPVTVDGPSTRKMLKLAEESVAKNLKVGVGLMYRHSKSRIEIHDRIQSGELGQIIALRSYRMHGPAGSFASETEPGKIERPALSDSTVPQFPLGQRRRLQRLLRPQHRRVLLDEGSLAGSSPGPRRPPLSRQVDRPELRHVLGRVHVRRRHEVPVLRPDNGRLLSRVRQLRPRHQGDGDRFGLGRPEQGPRLQGAARSRLGRRLEVFAARREHVPAWNGKTWSTPSARTSPTTR